MYFPLSIEEEILVLNQYLEFLKQRATALNFKNASTFISYLRSEFVAKNIQEAYQAEVMIVLSRVDDMDTE